MKKNPNKCRLLRVFEYRRGTSFECDRDSAEAARGWNLR